MKFIADFHIHSHFSIATSKKLAPEYLDYWAGLKGINIIGTGDAVHPGWLSELREKLEPRDNGLFMLKDEFTLDESRKLFSGGPFTRPYFILTAEISCIYKKNGRVRKVHNICVFPDFESVEKLQGRLDKIGNIRSDGRPILGLDSKLLLEYLLETSDSSYLIPAHIWTPWFSVLGSKSGFDSIEECYEDLTPMIFAVETGLSSDPAMNRACSILDRFRLVSNSDAHSPEKLGREANIFDTNLSYQGVFDSLRNDSGFLGTLEFHPQEGKYHYDGHRKCGIKWDPLETIRHGGICPVCNKEVTLGVMYRVAEMADRADPESAPDKKEFHSITQMADILAEIHQTKNSNSVKIRNEYFRIIGNLGPEFSIFLDRDISEIERAGGDLLAEGIKRMREGAVFIEEGYDGEFGRIRLFRDEELQSMGGKNLFRGSSLIKDSGADHETAAKGSIKFNIDEFKALKKELGKTAVKEIPAASGLENGPKPYDLSDEQLRGVVFFKENCVITAGPGSGKTRVLTERILHLAGRESVDPENILVLTFSNKAAGEIRERVEAAIPGKGFKISTIHAFGLSVLKKYHEKFGRGDDFTIIEDDERKDILEAISGDKRIRGKLAKNISLMKQGMDANEDINETMDIYDDKLMGMNAFDLDDLVNLPVRLLRGNAEILEEYNRCYKWVLVDEFQDINSSQYALIRLLAGGAKTFLFAIGDPDQSIYGFRGSDYRFMEKLKADYPGIRDLSLSKSYRCPEKILKTGSHVIGKKGSLEGRRDKLKVRIVEMDSARSEADWIAARIEEAIGGVRSFSMDSGISDGSASDGETGFSDFSILCRASFMFEPMMEALGNHGISFQAVDTKPFYKREPVKPFMDYLKKHLKAGNAKVKEKIDRDIMKLIADKKPLSEITGEIIRKLPSIDFICPLTQLEIRDITAFTGKFGCDYWEFLRAVSMNQGIDCYDDNREAVSLMTLHSSKGLEWDTVFIPGCEEGIIPFEIFEKLDEEGIKEERRLLYVGITRSMKNLYLTHSRSRIYKGRILKQGRSRFLNDLEKGLIDYQARKAGNWNSDIKGQLDLFEDK